jgi:CheY-like chemotaxis protein
MLKRLFVNDSSDRRSPAIPTSICFATAVEKPADAACEPVTASFDRVTPINFEEASEQFRGWVPSDDFTFVGEPNSAQFLLVARTQILRGFQVLVVDDEEDSLELLRMILESEGAKVTTVTSAEAALQNLTAYSPNILISDIGMPKMDGYMLIRQVRLQEAKGNLLPAIALTAYVGQEEERKAVAAGFQLYLAKPIAPDDLIQAIAALLR